MGGTAPEVGLLVGAALCVAVTGVLVWIFLRVARREKDAANKRPPPDR